MAPLQIVFLLLFPAVITLGLRRFRKLNFLSPILLCYLAGFIVANFSVVDRSLSTTISEISVPLAIPLLLFSTHITRWLRLAKKTILSFLLVIFSALASAFAFGMLFSSRIDEFWKISGMLVGVYTGGTPNLMAIGLSLGVRQETFVLVHTADSLIGGLYIIFLLFAAKPLLQKFLPPFQSVETDTADDCLADKEESFRLLPVKTKLGQGAASLGLAAVIVALSLGVSHLLTGTITVGAVILIVTTLGIAGSFIAKLRRACTPYALGQYLLLIFSLAVGSTIDLQEILTASPVIFLFTAAVMLGAILIHLILAALIRIDVDTTLITSTAGIYGPPFVVPVAAVLKNREVLAPGLLCGLVGYAVGNYLGLFMAYILSSLLL
ncbi:MAG: DUF819 family protein [Bacillota bacterium]